MSRVAYLFPITHCDVDDRSRKKVAVYRDFRDACLERIRGESDTSIASQVHDLSWHTAVFKSLNEARRLEENRDVNGPMWHLIVAGYANIMTLGIRKLVDQDPKAGSVWNLIDRIAKRPDLLTRELYVCHDGVPYDFEAVRERLKPQGYMPPGTVRWISPFGPDAWSTSQLMHESFDRLCAHPKQRKRTDQIDMDYFEGLKKSLTSSCIGRVKALASKRMAHAERRSEHADAIPEVTYEDVDEALKIIVSVTNWISTNVFADNAFGSVVATPEFEPMEYLDQPWVTPQNIPALEQHWRELADTMDGWADADPFVSPT
ncbi:hypothetical protein PPUJ20066_09800 [Pseudomonas putida]|nr:hypothetical protein PPUJ20066_09800 [Pseudomonas putida]